MTPFPKQTRIYHGSPVAFDAFSLDHVGQHGTDGGHGIYFTASRDEAIRYATICGVGYLYEAEVIGTRNLKDDAKTLTRKEITAILATLDEANDYLSNYGDIPWEPYETVLTRAVDAEDNGNDSDVDLIGSLINAGGPARLVLETVHRVTGYDCIHVTERERSHYIALVPSAVRLIRRERLNAPA